MPFEQFAAEMTIANSYLQEMESGLWTRTISTLSQEGKAANRR